MVRQPSPEFCMDILSVFCDIDDFCSRFEPAWHQHLIASGQKRQRASSLALSEVMAILVLCHGLHYRTFKHFYLHYVCIHLRSDFPGLPSYSRFVELIPSTLVPLCSYVQSRRGQPTGIQFIDSLPIRVCHNRRIHSHRVFDGFARRGKSSMGWFYGFKLHLVINDQGELLGMALTSGNSDDRRPLARLVRQLWGKLFGDRGYISQKLFDELWAQGLQLVTKLKRKMKNKLMPILDKILLRKRALIECVNDQLKNISQIEHTRHRSVANGFVNIIAAVVAYTFQPKKPALDWDIADLQAEQQTLLAATIL
jgi:Transposase DDE domain